ncbi:MAG: MBL fold metallo-hydrolase [Thermoleophilia bacterium]|nr:MBL fold metallo-hydrolase [Thermoleophilia bacterium]
MLNSLRSRIALATVKKQLPKLMSADLVAELGDGLHIAIVGSGSPLPDRKRGNPCAAIIASGKVFIVDAGERSSETISRMRIEPGRIAAVLLTHFHSDHIGGLGSVNLQRWVADGDPNPMRVIGPPGTERVVAGFNEAYALDSSYRTAHHGEDIAPSSGSSMLAEVFSFPEGEESMVVLDEDGLKVTAFVVDHSPVDPALGYRFDYQGRSIVISGDTVYSLELIRVSRGADLLVHDALSPRLLKMVEGAARRAGLANRARILADVPDYHATSPQAADAAREAGVGALALTHIVPPLPLKGLDGPFLGDAHRRFTGPLWLAADGDVYSLPAGGSGVERKNLFGWGPGG